MHEYNTISPIRREVNNEYLFWKTGKNDNNNFSCNNNRNQHLENCYDDRYGVHSESIDSNSFKIPNDGERVVLLSSVSRVVRNDEVVQDNKDSIDELDASQRKFFHGYSNNYDDEYVDIPSLTLE